MAKNTDHQAIEREILEKLDLRGIYTSWGCQITKETPTKSGWLECRVIGGNDKNASGAIGVAGDVLGRYSNRKDQTNISFWDAAMAYGGLESFQAAKKHYAEIAGVELAAKAKPAVEILNWSDKQAQVWAEAQGFGLAALKFSGACFLMTQSKAGAKFKNIGWEVYSPSSTGKYTYRHIKPGELILGRKENMVPGCPVGFINKHAIDRLREDTVATVIWVEGTTDMLALETAKLAEGLPNVAVIANNAGTACPSSEVIKTVLGREFGPAVILIGDCDTAGQEAVARRAEQVKYCARHRVFSLGYEIAEKGGKDVRDWLADGHSIKEILDEAGVTWNKIAKGEPPKVETTIKERKNTANVKDILARLDLHILGRDETGDVAMWNGAFSRWERIKNLERWGIKSFLSVTGEPGNREVCVKVADDDDNRMPWEIFSREVACITAGQVVSTEDRWGMGIWRGSGDDVVIVTKGWAAIWDGQDLRRLDKPIYEGKMLEIGSGEQWIDFDPLKELLRQASSHEWTQSVLEDAATMFGGWRWGNQDMNPRIVVGLILCTFLQDLLEWCPQVVVIGESNSGKSFLLNALSKLFTPLGRKSSHSTDSGLRQAIGFASRPMLIDEWDSTKNREGILLTMRVACRGDDRYVGTSGQRVLSSSIKQVFWAAGITSGLQDQADVNRFIQLKLLTKREEDARLQLRSGDDLLSLGHQLVAIAVRYGLAGISRAQLIQDGSYGVDSRVVESVSYPAGLLFAALGLSSEDCKEPLRALLTSSETKEVQTDQESLMESILGQSVDSGGTPRRQSIGQLITSAMRDSDQLAIDVLAREGIAVGYSDPKRLDSQLVIVFAYTRIRNNLLRGTKYAQQNVDELLQRIPTSKMFKNKRFNGLRLSWVGIDYEYFNTTFGYGGQKNLESWDIDDEN